MDHKTTLSTIFSPRKNRFAVPNYQRAYSWEVGTEKDKHVPQFLTDLKEHPATVPHYHLGHFLFEQDKSDAYKFWVIDGQQRLTTSIILMSCIYRRLKDFQGQEKEAENLYNEYLKNCDGQQKFLTVDYDNNFFINCVIENFPDDEITRSRRRISECRKYFDEELKNAKLEEILHWKLLIEEAKITTDTIADKAEATQVFTFQNDRGKELTSLERIKAFLMLQIYLSCKSSDTDPNDAIRYIEKEFEAIYENLERISIADEDQILGYHTTAFIALSGTVIDRIKDAFAKISTTEKQHWIKRFATELKQSYEKAVKIQEYQNRNSYVADVLYLDQASCFPLLLKLLRHNVDSLEDIAHLIETTLFKLKYTTGNYYSNYFPNLALEFNGDTVQLKSRLESYAKSGFKDYWDFDGSFLKYLEGDNHYFSLTRYLLWKYENFLRDEVKEPPMLFFEFSNLYGVRKFDNTIDHWAPQNPHGVEYEQEFNVKYLHNIGNMVLSTRSRNASDGNKLPENRITASTLISRQKLEPLKNNWGKNEIAKRQRDIVDFAIGKWIIKS